MVGESTVKNNSGASKREDKQTNTRLSILSTIPSIYGICRHPTPHPGPSRSGAGYSTSRCPVNAGPHSILALRWGAIDLKFLPFPSILYNHGEHHGGRRSFNLDIFFSSLNIKSQNSSSPRSLTGARSSAPYRTDSVPCEVYLDSELSDEVGYRRKKGRLALVPHSLASHVWWNSKLE